MTLRQLQRVSFGNDITRPSLLTSEPMGEILAGIGNGRWAEQVHRVRQLDYKSEAQDAAKVVLPYFTPSGLFKHRSAAGLIVHSGHVAIDLDDLGSEGATQAIQAAVADPHCKCAFRSATGHGVRLIFGCPPSTPAGHKIVFDRVADHVRHHYGTEPDPHGSDVSRASFVSLDNGLWLRPNAETLPGLEAIQTTHREESLCMVSEGDFNTLAYGIGESRVVHSVKEDGTAYTHFALVDLARDLVVQFRRHGWRLTEFEIERALRSWWRAGNWQGFRFRCKLDAYRHELHEAINSVQRVPWLDRVINFWRRWTKEADFPSAGSSDAKLEYAIRRHCAEAGSNQFYLSARSAATVTGTKFAAANDTLHRLEKNGILKRLGKPLCARDAQEFKLIDPKKRGAQ